MKLLIVIFIIVNLCYFVINEEIKNSLQSENIDKSQDESNQNEVFVPTNEWKVVKKGQSIPKGLHVRINLETGMTEAKLLDDELKDDAKKNALLSLPENEELEKEKNKVLEISRNRLKEALKKIKNEDLSANDEELMKRVTEKFKKYEEIKNELDKLNVAIKTDNEILQDLFRKYEETLMNKQLDKQAKFQQINNYLEDIEYLVHQIDNANEFIKLDGFNKILYKNFNSSSTKIKCQVLNILGSATQNNPKVQIYALETGSIDKILRILALETNNQVLSKAMYAISSLLRRFPLAQQQFIKNGGLSVLSKLFEKPDKVKIQLKIVTIIYDLLMEQDNAVKDIESPDFKEKLRQYQAVDLKAHLKELNWCDIFSTILLDIYKSDKENHDSIEKCLNVMYLLNDICKYDYSSDIKKILLDLNSMYKKLSQDEIDENSQEVNISSHTFYFHKMKELTDNLLNSLNIVKTEL